MSGVNSKASTISDSQRLTLPQKKLNSPNLPRILVIDAKRNPKHPNRGLRRKKKKKKVMMRKKRKLHLRNRKRLNHRFR